MGWTRSRAKVVVALGLLVPAIALASGCSTAPGSGECVGAGCDDGGGDALLPEASSALDTGLGPDALDASGEADTSDTASSTDASDAMDSADAAGGDAESSDDAASSTDAADASDAATCAIGGTDPTTPSDVTAKVYPTGSFRCGDGRPQQITANTFELTRETAFTAFISHTLNHGAGTQVQLRAGCGLASTLLFSTQSLYRTESRVVPPGVYTFVECDGRGNFFAEPTPTPTPANTDTTCANASTLPNTGGRMYDSSQTRYFRFKAGPDNGSLHRISLDGTRGTGLSMNTGRARFVLRTACDDAATNVFDTDTVPPFPSNNWSNGPKQYFPTGLVGGQTYWLVLSEVDPGLLLRVTYDRAF